MKDTTDTFGEYEIDVPALKKKIWVMTVGSAEGLTESFNVVNGLIKANRLKDKEAGLDPKKPSHEIVREADGRYRLKRLAFIC